MDNLLIREQKTLSSLNKRKKYNFHSISTKANIIINIIMMLFSIICVFPFLLIVMASFTDEKTLLINGYSLFPKKFSLKAYNYIFKVGDQLLNSYGVTIIITIIGTIITLLITSLYAYAIFRRSFKYKKFFTFYAFFTMLFNGGLVPTYMVCTLFLNLKDTIWALILPLALNAFHILILRTFFKTTIPESIIESVQIDGGGEFRIFFQIVLPISLPGLATIGLFSTLAYWNDWINALLYIEKAKLVPLQAMLMRIENSMEFILQNSSMIGSYQTDIIKSMPRETVRMAMVVLATIPIALAYPFFQRYFIKGLTIGAIKG